VTAPVPDEVKSNQNVPTARLTFENDGAFANPPPLALQLPAPVTMSFAFDLLIGKLPAHWVMDPDAVIESPVILNWKNTKRPIRVYFASLTVAVPVRFVLLASVKVHVPST
jgi:hypothetical protein